MPRPGDLKVIWLADPEEFLFEVGEFGNVEFFITLTSAKLARCSAEKGDKIVVLDSSAS